MFYQFYQYFQRPNFVSLVFCLLLHVFFTIISIISLLLLFLGLLHFFWLLEMEIEITAFTALLFCFLWVLLANFCHTHHYCFHFRDRETEAQRACNSSRLEGYSGWNLNSDWGSKSPQPACELLKPKDASEALHLDWTGMLPSVIFCMPPCGFFAPASFFPSPWAACMIQDARHPQHMLMEFRAQWVAYTLLSSGFNAASSIINPHLLFYPTPPLYPHTPSLAFLPTPAWICGGRWVGMSLWSASNSLISRGLRGQACRKFSRSVLQAVWCMDYSLKSPLLIIAEFLACAAWQKNRCFLQEQKNRA